MSNQKWSGLVMKKWEVYCAFGVFMLALLKTEVAQLLRAKAKEANMGINDYLTFLFNGKAFR